MRSAGRERGKVRTWKGEHENSRYVKGRLIILRALESFGYKFTVATGNKEGQGGRKKKAHSRTVGGGNGGRGRKNSSTRKRMGVCLAGEMVSSLAWKGRGTKLPKNPSLHPENRGRGGEGGN